MNDTTQLPATFPPVFNSILQAPSVQDIPIDELLRRAVLSARDRNVRGKHPRWVGVMWTFGVGSAYATQLCRLAGVNPGELVN